MKVAVTAVSGNLGSSIAKQLNNEIGHDNVIGIARTPEKAIHLNIEIYKGDYNNKADFVTALEGIDVVLIVSGMDHPDKRIIQHRNIIQAAREAGVKKIVYTSIIGNEGDSSFDPIVNSNRQTEKDVMESGLNWSIGRNGLYIEPDIEYLENYKRDGKIMNCAGEGLCSYTTREELAFAYSQMVLNENRNGKVFNLAGEPITQRQLTEYLNKAFKATLYYEEISTDSYLDFQKKVNGDFLGTVIAGIYTKIRNGEFNIESDFEAAAGRKHITWGDYFNRINI